MLVLREHSRVQETSPKNGAVLTYYEYLSEQLRQIKQSLAAEIANPEGEISQTLMIKKKLLSWLKNMPAYLTLQCCLLMFWALIYRLSGYKKPERALISLSGRKKQLLPAT